MVPDSVSERAASLERVIRARHMVRTFTDDPVDANVLDTLLDLARRAPSAGNTQAVEFLVLDTPEAVDRYWDTTLTTDKRRRFRWQGLLHSPALVIVTTAPSAYLDRYSEADKARPGLGNRENAWTQPFWWIDAGMVAQNLLLLATAHGLGASLFGIFDHETALRSTFDVPAGRRLVCTVAIGHPSADDEPGRSAGRPRPTPAEVIHRGRWSIRPS